MTQIELYRFARGSQVWTKTSSSDSVVYNSETYLPAIMRRSENESKPGMSKASLEITLDINDVLAQDLLLSFTERAMSVSVFNYSQALTTIVWKGRLVDIRPDASTVVLVFENVSTSMRRPALRAKYQKICRYALYGRGCYVNATSYEISGTVTSLLGGVVATIPAASFEEDGYYIGGVLMTTDGTLAFIVDHVGTLVTIQRPCAPLSQEIVDFGSASVKIYPGCNKLRETCLNKFSNLDNFGGFPWIPSENPLSGNSIV